MTIRLGHITEYCMKCKKRFNFGHLTKVMSRNNKKIDGWICKKCKGETI